MLTQEDYDKIARSGCFVCRIVEGKPLLPNPQIIYQDNKIIAFLTQLPTQEGYTLVSPKKHYEHYEEMPKDEWLYLMDKVQVIAKAVAKSTQAIRMYVASVGMSDRNAHVHIHICPCSPGTPPEEQQFKAMDLKDGKYLKISDKRMQELATQIKANLE